MSWPRAPDRASVDEAQLEQRDTWRAMSEESATPDLVELSRRLGEAINRRDFDAVEGFYAPQAAYRRTELGTFEGAAAIRGLLEDMASSYEEFEGDAEEILDLGNGVTFAVLRARGRPVGSSAEVRIRWAAWALWTECLIERETAYMDIDEARAAAERLAAERR
jgi:ketosteroid isomerase-like protein